MLAPWFGGFGGLFDQFEESTGPYVTVRDAPDAVTLELEVPRFKPENIKVTSAGNGRLVVEGMLPEGASPRGRFLFGDGMMNHFKRSFYFPPALYDATKFTSTVEHGVLTVKVPVVPKPPAPEPLELAVQSPKNAYAITTTEPESFKAIRKMKWPPQVKIDDTAAQLTYTCQMPPAIGKEHVSLQLEGNHLRLSVKSDNKVEKKDDKGNVRFSESSSVNYSTSLSVPAGTAANDITTSFSNGILMVTLAKHPQAVPVATTTTASAPAK